MNLVNDSSTSVVGGGTAGLTVAARLSEDPNIQVLVLEAGNDHSDDVNVLAPGLFATLYGNPEYDWNYQNVPQVSDSVHSWRLPLPMILILCVETSKQPCSRKHSRQRPWGRQRGEFPVVDARVPARYRQLGRAR